MLRSRIKQFKSKYYKVLMVSGASRLLALLLSLFLIITLLEHFARFDSNIRAFFFYGFIATSFAALSFWLLRPLLTLLSPNLQITDLKAAQLIGEHFKPISDKLYNALQLSALAHQSDLVAAGLTHRESELQPYDFREVVNYKIERKYLWFLVIPATFLLLTLLTNPSLFRDSTARIINYDQSFTPPPPFSFQLQNENLTAYKGENLTVNFGVEGTAVPKTIKLITEDGKTVNLSITDGKLNYTFSKLFRDTKFKLSAAGFESILYDIKVIARPTITGFDLEIEYPRHLNKSPDRFSNQGNFRLPEGSKITWAFKTQDADQLFIDWAGDTLLATNEKSRFMVSQTLRETTDYSIGLRNENATNKESIDYRAEAIKDQYPKISIVKYQDSTSLDYLLVGGNISDDHGFTKLVLNYRIISDGSNPRFFQKKISIDKNLLSQLYYYQIDLKELEVPRGATIEYYTEVWDNDSFNNPKKADSRKLTLKIPTKEDIKKAIEESSKETESSIELSLKKSQEVNKRIQDIQKKMKTKRRLDWQDKKEIKDLIEENQKLQNQIEKTNQFNKELNQKKENESEKDKEIAEKAEQLKKLMEDLQNEETKKLYEELNKLLEEQTPDLNKMDEILEQIDINQENLENELDRAIEMFKQLKVEEKANQIAEELKDLAEVQKDLADQTQESKKSDLEEIEQKQEQIQEEFEKIQEEMQELEEMNQELEKPNDLDQMEEEKEETEQKMEESTEELQKKNKNKASDAQKKASGKMEEMSEKLQQMMSSSSMEKAQEDYDDLRKILENLVQLSFDQERIMKGFRGVSNVDPKFIQLSQEQLKLKDDAQIIKDSLLALSKRVFQIESFVTRELNTMDNFMEKSMAQIKDRIPRLATSNQQFAMTSMNNLALMLSDVLKQMQQEMSGMMSGSQMNQQKGKGKPSLSELQQQLNQQIRELKKGSKPGEKGMSQQLAKMAAQQEAIRRALQQKMQEQGGSKPNGQKPGGKGGDGDPLEMMEEVEEDLVNKRITQQLIERQQDILTRLLESEKAERERDQDEKREAESAKEKEREIPPAFLEYIKQKEQQVEMLKTVPASLQKYYKDQVNSYFKRIVEKSNGR